MDEELKSAFRVVLCLAQQNVLAEDECGNEPELKAARQAQLKAVRKVSQWLHAKVKL